MPQCAINNFPSSEFWQKFTQLATQLTVDSNNLLNLIWHYEHAGGDFKLSDPEDTH